MTAPGRAEGTGLLAARKGHVLSPRYLCTDVLDTTFSTSKALVSWNFFSDRAESALKVSWQKVFWFRGGISV